MIPNTGYSSNAAIKSAATLTNAIKEMLNTVPGSRPDESWIKVYFKLY